MVKLNSNKLRQLSFYSILIAWAIFIFYQLWSFFPALLGAITFYILMRKPMNFLVNKRKWHTPIAAMVLMLASFLIILLPITILINVLYAKIDYAIQNSNQLIAILTKIINSIEVKYHIEIISDKNLEAAGKTIAEIIPQIVGATFNTVIIIAILYFVLYFLLINHSSLEKWLIKNVPLKDENVQLIGNELQTLVTSNAIGIPVTALIQGILGAIAYWILGVSDIAFWFVVTCLAAIVPMVGSSLAFIPIALLLFADGFEVKGIILLLYGFGIMYTLDSFFRMAIQKKMGNVHPLITTFGVIIGLKLFGFIGLVFGPILLAMFILFVRIYLNEFSDQ